MAGATGAGGRNCTLRDLALTAAAMLPEGPIVVHDLAAGHRSMMRWLAPLLPGRYVILHDWTMQTLIERAIDASVHRIGTMPLFPFSATPKCR